MFIAYDVKRIHIFYNLEHMEQFEQLMEIDAEMAECKARMETLRARMEELAARDHAIRAPAIAMEALRSDAACDVPRLDAGFVVLENGAYCAVTRGRAANHPPMYYADAGYETWFQVGGTVYPPERAAEFHGGDPTRRVFVHMITQGQRGEWGGERYTAMEETLWGKDL